MDIVIYVPPGAHPDHSLPCLLMTPTMGDPLEGETVVEADLDEALSLASKGIVVALYDTSRFAFNNRPQRTGECVTEYVQSDGGQHFARNAANAIFAKATMVNPNRVYSAGYGAAAPVAIGLAASDSRIHGIIAYSPVCDIAAHLGKKPGELDQERRVQGLDAFTSRISPINLAAELKVPTLILTMGPPSPGDATGFANALKVAGVPVTVVPLQPAVSAIEARNMRMQPIIDWVKTH